MIGEATQLLFTVKMRTAAALLAAAGAVLMSAPAARAGDVSPANDRCEGALTIEPCGAFPKLSAVANLTTATADGDPVATCGRHAGGGVWFSFTPSTSETYTFTTCAAEAPGTTVADTVLALYNSKDNVCPSRAQVACNNDDDGCEEHPLQSMLKARLTAGTRYFVVAYAAAPGAAGNVQVAVSKNEDSLNGNFETGDFTGWAVQGVTADVAIVPKDPPPACFVPDMPSDGCFMACMSTGSFFGGASNGGVRSDLTSDAITFDFRPGRLRVSFDVVFATQEPNPSTAFNDAFQARLVTNAGTYVILQIDTFGRTPNGKGLKVVGESALTPVAGGCSLDSGLRTKRLNVSWTKTLDPTVRQAIDHGPIYIEFSVSNQGNTERTSLACVDGVKVEGLRAE